MENCATNVLTSPNSVKSRLISRVHARLVPTALMGSSLISVNFGRDLRGWMAFRSSTQSPAERSGAELSRRVQETRAGRASVSVPHQI